MLPPQVSSRLKLPIMVAPMFLISTPTLVIQACKQGIVGSFPTLNTRTTQELDQWLTTIERALKNLPSAAPFAVNLIVHKTNPKLKEHLDMVVKHKVPIVITSLGAVASVIDAVHSYNGLVFHDITNLYHGRKAVSAGVDGLIAVCGGAGGHAGLLSPCAFLPMLRAAFPKLPIVVGGGISDGRMVRAMQVGGADLSYLGTRFIATQEANASAKYKAMLVHTKQVDGPELPIVYTNRVSGVYANFLKDSLVQAGLDPKRLVDMKPVEEDFSKLDSEAKAWKDIWSAGHGTLNIHDIPTVEALVKRLSMEYFQAMEMEVKDIALWKEKSKL